jgi:hypothetical protein
MTSQIIETEETLIIETPERVPLEFALASIGNRSSISRSFSRPGFFSV